MKDNNLFNKVKKELKNRPYIIIVLIMTYINLNLYSIIGLKAIQGVKSAYFKFLVFTIRISRSGGFCL